MSQRECLRLLCEGVSAAEIGARTGTSLPAIRALKADAGAAAVWYQDRVLRRLAADFVHIDATRTFATEGEEVWTWIAIAPETRLVIAWLLGDRDRDAARAVIADVRARVSHPLHLVAQDGALSLRSGEDADGESDRTGITAFLGRDGSDALEAGEAPDLARKARLDCRHFARFSKALAGAVEEQAQGLALSVLFHNFVRLQENSRATPAMAAGITESPWQTAEIEDVLRLWTEQKTGPWYERVSVLRRE